jgi:hypothetical protein
MPTQPTQPPSFRRPPLSSTPVTLTVRIRPSSPGVSYDEDHQRIVTKKCVLFHLSHPLALPWQRRAAPRRWKPRTLSFKPARASRSLLYVCVPRASPGAGQASRGGARVGAHGPQARKAVDRARPCVLCGWPAAWLLPGSWPPSDRGVSSAGGCARLAACSPTCYAWRRAAREHRGLPRACVRVFADGERSLLARCDIPLNSEPKS